MKQRRKHFLRGLRAGIPVGLGYFAVGFTLGITARNMGLSAMQAGLTSFLVNASAGQYVAFTLMGAGAGYLELALMELVANARYLLMSCSLSQKLSPQTGLGHRLLIGFDVTDELFGLAMREPGMLEPWYFYGLMGLALPGWALGTYFGVLMGNVLPAIVTTALSVALYGMFLAVIIPAAKKNRIILGLIVVSMCASALFAWLPALAQLSAGTRTLILTVALASLAAILFPVKEEAQDES